MNDTKKLTIQTIVYLINKLGSNREGKKKIMKLMFLLEHFDIKQNKLTKQGFLGNSFYIYNYGVFSIGVMDSYNKLIKEGYVKDGFPLTTRKIVKLDEHIRPKVDKIIEKFGNKTGYNLEVETLRMLGIQPYEKEKYYGQDIVNFIKD